jgi:hypothetical protein
MLNDTSCRFFVETEILSWLCRSSLGSFDLLEILLHASELFENGMFLRLDTVESQVRLRDVRTSHYSILGVILTKQK